MDIVYYKTAVAVSTVYYVSAVAVDIVLFPDGLPGSLASSEMVNQFGSSLVYTTK